MGDRPIGERVSEIEGVLSQLLPAIQDMNRKLDAALDKASKESVREAHQEIDKLREEVANKVDKGEFDEVQRTVTKWGGAFGVILFLISLLSSKILALISK